MAETGWKGVNQIKRPPLDPEEELNEARKEREAGHAILEIKTNVEMLASIVSFMAILMLAASIFTLPFPLVRKIWLEDVWGYYGLMNTCAFLLIASAMKRMSLAAVVVGIGILTYDQLLTWRSFLFLHLHRNLSTQSVLFVGLSLLVVGILIAVFVSSYHALSRYYRFKQSYASPSHRDPWILRLHPSLDAGLFLGGVALYLILFLTVSSVESPDAKVVYSLLRLLGGMVTLLGFFGIGLEIERMLRTSDYRSLPFFKILVHGTFLIWLLRIIQLKMPLELIVK